MTLRINKSFWTRSAKIKMGNTLNMSTNSAIRRAAKSSKDDGTVNYDGNNDDRGTRGKLKPIKIHKNVPWPPPLPHHDTSRVPCEDQVGTGLLRDPNYLVRVWHPT